MTAFFLSAVITRGLETTLPRLSASRAESSTFTRLPLPRLRIDRARRPAAPAIGRFTLSCSGCAPTGTVPVTDVPTSKPAMLGLAPVYTREAEPRDCGLPGRFTLVSVRLPETPKL